MNVTAFLYSKQQKSSLSECKFLEGIFETMQYLIDFSISVVKHFPKPIKKHIPVLDSQHLVDS